jgi:acetyl-CoA acetyltransferase family protein
VYIVGCVRTPIARGYQGGALNGIKPVELLALTLQEVVKRSKVPVEQVEDVICGCVSPVKDQGANIPRFAALLAGFPVSVPGVQLNRMCGSGQQAVHFAAQAIGAGHMDAVIACGIEMMSVVPMGSDWKLDEGIKNMPYKILHQGVSAEMIAEKYKLTREDLDRISGRSHENAAEAIKKGYFKKEIMPVTITKADGTKVVVDKDEGVRVPVDYARMKALKTPFKAGGLITAANASQISDGSSAVMLVSGSKLKELKLKPLARVVACVTVGSDPELMLTGPIPATQKVLKKAGLTIKDIDLFEINEAFASVVLAWIKELGPDPEKVNPNGGAIAMGHPLGASGAILMTKMVHDLERNNKRYGLQTMCIGFGQATATIIENLNATPKSKL